MYPMQSFSSKLFDDFRTFVNQKKQIGTNCEGLDAEYVPQSALRNFWTEEKIDGIFQLFNKFADAKNVRQNYLLVFSILVYISPGKDGPLLHDFDNIQTHQKNDASLPWLQGTQKVFEGQHASRNFTSFLKHQWMFCPVLIDKENRMMNRALSPDHILPFRNDTDRRINHDGRDAELSVVTIDMQAHSHLNLKSMPPPRAVVKSYRAKGHNAYKNEYEAYKALYDTHPNVLGYLGSFYGAEKMSLLLEYAEEGTLEDKFAANDTPYTYDDIRSLWRSFQSLVEGLERMNVATVVHQDLKPSNIFVFKDTARGASPFSYILKIGDFGNSHTTRANGLGYSEDVPFKGGSRTYAPPEVLLEDSINYLVNKHVDIWGIGCIIVESAVWVAFGERGRNELRESRMQEISSLPRHRDLGHGDCFHDGRVLLSCVAEGIWKDLQRNGRRCDTITPAMVKTMVEYALTEWEARDVARQLASRMSRVIFPTTQNSLGPQSPTSPPQELNNELNNVHTAQPIAPVNLNHGQVLDQEPRAQASFALADKTTAAKLPDPPATGKPKDSSINKPTLDSGPLATKLTKAPPPKEVQTPTTKVTISQLIKWIDDQKNNRDTELPGWESAKGLLDGRDFLLIVDNSKFMKEEREEVIKVVGALSYLLKKLDKDGIEVICTSNPNIKKRCRNATDVEKFIKDTFPKGRDAACKIENVLDVVVDDVKKNYFGQARTSRLSRTFSTSKPPASQSISIFVFTNGQWNDDKGACGADIPIRRLINDMDSNNVARTRICFQFVRFGNSEIGKQRLKFLDDDLSKITQNGKYDIVDCKSTESSIWDILLGPLDPEADRMEDP